MKKIINLILASFVFVGAEGQVSGSFVVNGDINTYYAVVFDDGGWNDNVATEMTLGRSNVHTDASWRGAMIARVRFHVTNWGHAANFVDVDMSENTSAPSAILNFIGGWMDGTNTNGSNKMLMWLRGGTTTYYYHSNYAISPIVHDGVQNPASFALDNTPGTISTKTSPDPYVRINGITLDKDVQTRGMLAALGSGNNYLAGSLSLNTTDNHGYQLAVNGQAVFNKVVVKQYPWSDYVFDTTYRLAPITEVDQFIRANHHLPEIPSADSVAKAGIDVGANQAALLKKIEELTLYVISLQQQIDELKKKK